MRDVCKGEMPVELSVLGGGKVGRDLSGVRFRSRISDTGVFYPATSPQQLADIFAGVDANLALEGA